MFNGRERWPYKQVQLQKQLAEEGSIKHEVVDGENRLTCRRSAGKRTHRVLVFERAIFEEALSGPRVPLVYPEEHGMAFDHDVEQDFDQGFALN